MYPHFVSNRTLLLLLFLQLLCCYHLFQLTKAVDTTSTHSDPPSNDPRLHERTRPAKIPHHSIPPAHSTPDYHTVSTQHSYHSEDTTCSTKPPSTTHALTLRSDLVLPSATHAVAPPKDKTPITLIPASIPTSPSTDLLPTVMTTSSPSVSTIQGLPASLGQPQPALDAYKTALARTGTSAGALIGTEDGPTVVVGQAPGMIQGTPLALAMTTGEPDGGGEADESGSGGGGGGGGGTGDTSQTYSFDIFIGTLHMGSTPVSEGPSASVSSSKSTAGTRSGGGRVVGVGEDKGLVMHCVSIWIVSVLMLFVWEYVTMGWRW